MAPRGAAQHSTVKSKFIKQARLNSNPAEKKKQEVKPPRPTSPKKTVKKLIYSPNVSSSELSDFTVNEEEPRNVHHAKLKDENEKKEGGDPPASTSTTSRKTPRELRAERRAAEIRREDFTDDEESGRKTEAEDKESVGKKSKGRKRKHSDPDVDAKGDHVKEKVAASTEPENQDSAKETDSRSNAEGIDLLGERPKRLKQKHQDPTTDTESEYAEDEHAPEAEVKIPAPLTDFTQLFAVGAGKGDKEDKGVASDSDSDISLSSEAKARFKDLLTRVGGFVAPVRSYSPASTSSTSSAASVAAAEDDLLSSSFSSSSPSPSPSPSPPKSFSLPPVPAINPFDMSIEKLSSSSSSSSSPPENVGLPVLEGENPFAADTSAEERRIPVADWRAELTDFVKQTHLARQSMFDDSEEGGPRGILLNNEKRIPVAEWRTALTDFTRQSHLSRQNMLDDSAGEEQNLTGETPASSPVPSEEGHQDDNDGGVDIEMNAEDEKSPWLVNRHNKVIDNILSGNLRKIALTLNFMARAKASGIDVDDTDALVAVSPEQWDQLIEVPDDAAEIMVQNLLSLPVSDIAVLAERASVLRDDLRELGITID
ncbi:hypothetical protein GGR58DRAFT_322802 [Xylaria digitata]|nr:hypothetical protein GGR58DRAFT_322802 [Xylaria digitata]